VHRLTSAGVVVLLAVFNLLVTGEAATPQKKPLQYPTRVSTLVKYNLFKATRVGSRSFYTLPQKRREEIFSSARAKAPAACKEMSTKYEKLAETDVSKLPLGWDYKYLAEYKFEHVETLNGKQVSPVFRGFTKEEVYQVGSRKMFEISAVFYCYGRWVDLNQGRFN
jgi:hypothetical protein